MTKVSYSTVFDQTADQVWAVIRDFNSYPVWVASVTEMTDEEMKLVTINNTEVCLARIGDQYFAMNNECTHGGAMLSLGHWIRRTISSSAHCTAACLMCVPVK